MPDINMEEYLDAVTAYKSTMATQTLQYILHYSTENSTGADTLDLGKGAWWNAVLSPV